MLCDFGSNLQFMGMKSDEDIKVKRLNHIMMIIFRHEIFHLSRLGHTQPTITCSKLTIETLESVKL